MRTASPWALTSMTLTAALSHSGAAAGQCPQPGEVVINEVAYLPTEAAFIELKGPPGANLDCLALRSFNGGSGGDQCTPALVLAFDATHTIPEDGYFVIATAAGDGVDLASAKADLQNGPDGLALVEEATSAVHDSLAYGGPLDTCIPPVREGTAPAPEHESGQSIGRAPDGQDSNQNGKDWHVCPTPSRGAANDCPVPIPCPEEPAALRINEVRIRPSANEFVEISGPPGLALDCYELRGIEGGTAGEVCDVKATTKLDGFVLNEAGLATPPLNIESTGAFGVQIALNDDDGNAIHVDAVKWGGAFDACLAAAGSQKPIATAPQLPVPDDDALSVSWCADEGFLESPPTPALVNDCSMAGEEGGEGPGEEGGESPGEEGGEGGPECTGEPLALRITEIQTGPADQAFIELHGPAEAALDCYAIASFNGKDGESCDEDKRFALAGHALGDDGYFLVATAGGDLAEIADALNAIGDLQNGPDAVAIVFTGDDGEVVVDSLVYGSNLAACEELGVGEGAAAPAPQNGESLSRCSLEEETNNNINDFQPCDAPSPGVASTCQCQICAGPGDEHPMLNELQTSVGNDSFVELFGPAGHSLSCYQLVGYNGDKQCAVYKTVALDGAALDGSGYFVVAPAGGSREADADLTYTGANFQSGPDAIALVYAYTDGTTEVVDSVVYKSAVEECAASGIGEGEASAPEPKRDRSITRCGGVDTDDNEADWTGCSTPTPGGPTECSCTGGGDPSPPGGGGSQGPGGCRTADPAALPWSLGGLIALLACGTACRRRARHMESRRVDR